MEKIEKYWKFITLIITIFSVVIGGFITIIKAIDNQNELLESTSKLAQKSVIWNESIPAIERAEACDIYLSKGYDSYTKKLCENVILQDEKLATSNEVLEEKQWK